MASSLPAAGLIVWIVIAYNFLQNQREYLITPGSLAGWQPAKNLFLCSASTCGTLVMVRRPKGTRPRRTITKISAGAALLPPHPHHAAWICPRHKNLFLVVVAGKAGHYHQKTEISGRLGLPETPPARVELDKPYTGKAR
jgi:hypothetical protein